MQLSESDFVRILEATRAVTSALSVSELLQTVMRLAGEVVHAEAASLLLLDPATDELYFDVALGEKGGALQRVRLKKGEGVAGWVAHHGEPAMVNDVAHDPRWTQKGDQASQFKTRSVLAVPLVARERKVGVLEAINRIDGQFSERDLKIFEFFAAQVAVAIENARLFDSIRQEKEKMSTILGQMAEGVLLVEPGGRIALANAAARRFLGRPLQDSSWPALAEEFDMKPAWDALKVSLDAASPIEVKRKAGPAFILAGVAAPVRDERSQVIGFLVVVSDVTEERREAQLKRNFLSLVSHKLRTPLVSIRGFAPMLLEKPAELNAFQRTAMEAIDRNSALLTGLVEKITWFAVLESDELELTLKPYSVDSVLDSALSEMAGYLQQSRAVVERDRSLSVLAPLPLDKVWMKESFRNLVENAVKFNPREPRLLKISGAQQDGWIELRFQDNGPGIPPEERTKLFQKFYQIESSFTGQVHGMGLGLALVRRVAEAHGGSAEVESTLGQGATFILRLPAQQPS